MNKSNTHWQDTVKVNKKYNFYVGVGMAGTSRGCRNRLYESCFLFKDNQMKTHSL